MQGKRCSNLKVGEEVDDVGVGGQGGEVVEEGRIERAVERVRYMDLWAVGEEIGMGLLAGKTECVMVELVVVENRSE